MRISGGAWRGAIDTAGNEKSFDSCEFTIILHSLPAEGVPVARMPSIRSFLNSHYPALDDSVRASKILRSSRA